MAIKLLLLLVGFSAVSAGRPKAILFGRPNHDNVDYYDCSTKADGNYDHPTDCTRFITCSNGRASDMACADCDQNNVVQCAGNLYTVYDAPKDYCNWPSETTCNITPVVTSPAPVETTAAHTTKAPVPTTRAPVPTTAAPVPTTEAPVPTTEEPIPTTEEPIPSTETPAPTTEAPVPTTEEPIPTTEEPIPSTETPAPTTEAPVQTTKAPTPTTETALSTTESGGDHRTCNGKKPGDSCDKTDCEQCGYCWDLHSFYLRCERTFPSDPKKNVTGVIVHEACDTDLWWNPDAKPAGVAIGGTCDTWDQLSKAVQEQYTNDPDCVTPVELCEYGQNVEDECSANYWYFDPKAMTDRQILLCADDLLWDPSTETCRDCDNVAGCSC